RCFHHQTASVHNDEDHKTGELFSTGHPQPPRWTRCTHIKPHIMADGGKIHNGIRPARDSTRNISVLTLLEREATRMVARTCSVGPRLSLAQRGRAADLQNRSALQLLVVDEYQH